MPLGWSCSVTQLSHCDEVALADPLPFFFLFNKGIVVEEQAQDLEGNTKHTHLGGSFVCCCFMYYCLTTPIPSAVAGLPVYDLGFTFSISICQAKCDHFEA